jgi:hypothetical protein
MNKKVYAPGGFFDQYAGDDKSMNLDEFAKMNTDFAAGISAKIGETYPAYPADQLKKIYDVYNALSQGEGVTKMDAIHGQGIYEKIRDRRISDAEIDQYYPVGELMMDVFGDTLESNPQAMEAFNDYIDNGMSKDV